MAKAFSWSFSKVKNFETCPKRHYEIDLAKNYTEPQNDQLKYGNDVHRVLAEAIGKAVPLPGEFIYLQKWADRVLAGPGDLWTEQKYAITKEFAPCAWFSPVAWYRGIGDVVRVNENVALILDWKTGKVLADSAQLALMAQCIFSHFPAVTHVRSEYVWTAHDTTTPEVYRRSDMVEFWPAMLARVAAMEQAATMLQYPPKPGGLCRKYCAVLSCPYHGKGSP